MNERASASIPERRSVSPSSIDQLACVLRGNFVGAIGGKLIKKHRCGLNCSEHELFSRMEQDGGDDAL